METGYIKLHRKITELNWYRKQKFTWASAWIDMLLMARWQDDELTIDYKKYDVPVGSFVTSQRKLAKKWRWSISTVNAFFNFLQKSEHQIEYKTEHSFTHIYILKWEEYQGKTEHQTEHQTERKPNTPRTLPEHSPKQIKKLKNDKNDKKEPIIKTKYLDFVYLTKEEYKKLQKRYGDNADVLITKMNNYAHQIGDKKFAKYKSHYHTALNWALRANMPEIIEQRDTRSAGEKKCEADWNALTPDDQKKKQSEANINFAEAIKKISEVKSGH